MAFYHLMCRWEELDDDEKQEVYEAIRSCSHSMDLHHAFRYAKTSALQHEILGRLVSTDFGRDTLEHAVLRHIAERTCDSNIRDVALRRAEFMEEFVRHGHYGDATLFNFQLVAYLYLNRNDLDFEDGHILDLAEYIMPKRTCAPSPVTRERARRLYELLPQERRDVIQSYDHKPISDVVRHRYDLVRRLMEQERDANRLEEAALGDGDGWISKFALARLSGWRACPEADQAAFVTFECDMLAGYPRERLEAFLDCMVDWGNLRKAEANELLAKVE